jgi:DNA-binding NarL/FixJ family response regulator
MHSIVLLHNDPLIADPLADVIRSTSGLQLAGRASTLAQARTMVERGTPDLLLGALCLEDGWSTRLMDEMRGPGRKGGPMLVVLAESFQDPHLMLALRHGADGYLVQGRGKLETAAAIKLVLGGGSPMSPEIARQVAAHFGRAESPGTAALDGPGPRQPTPQERLMLDCIGQGCSTHEIAHKLQISEAQVNVRIRNLYRKLQFDLRAGTLHPTAA